MDVRGVCTRWQLEASASLWGVGIMGTVAAENSDVMFVLSSVESAHPVGGTDSRGLAPASPVSSTPPSAAAASAPERSGSGVVLGAKRAVAAAPRSDASSRPPTSQELCAAAASSERGVDACDAASGHFAATGKLCTSGLGALSFTPDGAALTGGVFS